MTDRRWRALRALVGAAVLVAVLLVAGPGAVATGVGSLDPVTVLLAVALAVPATLACAWRWQLVARGLGLEVGLGAAVAACYRAQLLNTTLPGGVVGDVHRGVWHGRSTGRTSLGLRAVVWERFWGQTVLAVLTVAALLALPSPVPRELTVLIGLAALCLGVGVAWLLRTVHARGDTETPARGLLAVVGSDVRRGLLAPGTWPGVVAASVVAVACHAATYLLAARAVGVTAPVAVLLPLVLLVFVAAAVPTNIAGWGPREGMAAWCFAAVGLGAGAGLATSVAFGVLVLVANLPGTVVLLTGVGERRPPTVAGADPSLATGGAADG